MTQPNGQLFPIGKEEEMSARQNLTQRSAKLSASLSFFLITSIILGILFILAIYFFAQPLQNYLISLIGTALPSWYQYFILFIIIIASVLHAWMFFILLQLLKAAKQQILEPSRAMAQYFLAKYKTVRSWIKFAQYFPIAIAIFHIGISVIFWHFAELWLGNQETFDINFNMTLWSHIIEIILISSIHIGINWLFCNAILQWSDNLAERLTTERIISMRLYSKNLQGWLLLTGIVIILQILSIAFFGAFYIFLPQILEQLKESAEGFSKLAIDLQQLISQISYYLGVLLLSFIPIYILLICNILWLRGFIFFSAIVLDANPQQQKSLHNQQSHDNEVVVVPQNAEW